MGNDRFSVRANRAFDRLAASYGIDEVSSVEAEVPPEVTEILEGQLVETDFGISWGPKALRPPEAHESVSVVEDVENHFHVDWHVADRLDELEAERRAFEVGLRTSFLLAEKLRASGFEGVQVSYCFHSIEMSRQMDPDSSLAPCFGDRLSFHRVRDSEPLYEDIDDVEGNAILLLRV